MSTLETSMLLATGLPLSTDPGEPGDEPGCCVEQSDDNDQDQRRAPGTLEGRSLGVADRDPELLVDQRGQRCLWVLVDPTGERVVLDLLVEAHQQQQRRCLAGDPGNAEHHAGDD